MRAFVLACVVAGIVAGGAAAILENLVQEPSSVAFAEPSARLLVPHVRGTRSGLFASRIGDRGLGASCTDTALDLTAAPPTNL